MNLEGASIDTHRLSYLRLVTQSTRMRMLKLICGHPQELPSIVELNHLLDEHKSTLYEHMELLMDAGVVARYIGDPPKDGQHTPYVFYGLTKRGYGLMESTTVFPSVQEMKQEYSELATEHDITHYADIPRPATAVDTVMDSSTVFKDNK